MSAAEEALERARIRRLREDVDRLYGELATARGHVGRIEREIREAEGRLWWDVRETERRRLLSAAK